MTTRPTPDTDAATRELTLRHLRAHPFARGFSEDDLEALAEHGRLQDFERGDVIFRAESEATEFYLIRTGVVALQVDAGRGIPRVIQTISEGSVLGWSWLYPPFEWQFDAVARTPVRAVVLDAAGLRAHFEQDPGLGYRVVARVAAVMADRLHATRQELLSR